MTGKLNIDTVKPNEDDLTWARYFLYPKPKSDAPFLLQPNSKGFKHALELVAAARKAARIEYTEQFAEKNSTVEEEIIITRNGRSRRANAGEKQAFNEAMSGLNSVFDDLNKKVFGPLRRIFKKG